MKKGILLFFLLFSLSFWDDALAQQDTCFDTYGGCAGRRAEGDCEDNEAFMRINCSLTCGFCSLTTAAPDRTFLPWFDALRVLETQGFSESLTEGMYVAGNVSTLEVDEENYSFWTNRTDVFNVSSSTGVITLAAAVDREVTQFIGTSFCASDGFTLSECEQYNIAVTDINDNTPVFSQSYVSFQLREDESVSSRSLQIPAINIIDADAGVNAEMNISCLANFSQETCDTFGLNIEQVAMGHYNVSFFLRRFLDFEEKAQYNLTLIAINDRADPALSATASVFVEVLEVVEAGPIFINTPLSLVVSEDASNNTEVGVLRARSRVSGNRVSFSITEDSRGYFSLGESRLVDGVYEAAIFTRAELDKDSLDANYDFYVAASETVDGVAAHTESFVTVSLLDVNDNAPVFSAQTYSVTLGEGLPANTIIPKLSILVTDADQEENSNFNISFADQAMGFLFELVPSQGKGSAAVGIKVLDASTLDYEVESNRQRTFELIAADSKSTTLPSSTATVSITLQDINDNPPSFAISQISFPVREDQQPGSLLYTAQASDPDSGEFGSLTYWVTGKDAAMFNVNSGSGQIFLAQALDFETQPRLEAVFHARDGGNLETAIPILVTVTDYNDLPPVFLDDLYETSVRETTFEPPIQVKATDRESDSTVTFRITSGNTQDAAFTMIPTTGVLGLTRPVLFSEAPNGDGIFRLNVVASDGGVPPLTANATIRVRVLDANTHDPIFNSTLYQGEVSEISPAGTSAVQVFASDLDLNENGRITFIIHSGSKDNFVIDPVDGVISVSPSANLEIERNGDIYDILVYAVDGGSPQRTAQTQAIINVIDANNKPPRFQQDNYLFYVSDNTELGHVVGTVKAIDPDDGSNVEYSMQLGTIQGKDASGQVIPPTENPGDFRNAFIVGSESGMIRTDRELNRDFVSQVSFEVVAKDVNAETEQLGLATVTVVLRSSSEGIVRFDQPWTVANPSILLRVNEEQSGLPIATLNATDTVTGQRVTNYREVPGSDPDNLFIVNQTTGEVRLNKRLDYETLPDTLLTFQVEAFSSTGTPPRSAMATIYVEVLDINDNSPEFLQNNYDFQVNEGTKYPTQIGIIIATDRDSGPFGTVRYHLEGEGSQNFMIDPANGNFTVAPGVVLDYDVQSEYNLRVVATDNQQDSSLQQTTEVPLRIALRDENKNIPVFERKPYYFYVQNSLGAHSSLGQVVANDEDGGAFGMVTYSLEPTDLFYIETTTGVIRNLIPLSRLNQTGTYELTVYAWDGAVPPKSGNTTAFINFISSPVDGRPILESPRDGSVVSVDENSPPNTEVIRVIAVNPSTSSQSGLTYDFVPNVNHDERFFNIDRDSGVITVNPNASLDRETRPEYQLTISVQNGQEPKNRITLRITVRLNDLNDTEPTFNCPQRDDPALYASVAENEPAGTYVTTVEACDKDLVPVIFYHIIGGNDIQGNAEEHYFRIDVVTGEIFTQVMLDREEKERHNLTVLASSLPQVEVDERTRRSVSAEDSTIEVIITVTDVDDSAPTFSASGDKIIAGVVTVAPFGSEVVRVQATDPDSLSTLSYSLKSVVFVDSEGSRTGSDDAFVINNVTGVLTSAEQSFIDKTEGHYEIQVVATDGAGQEASATLTIVVIRENSMLRFVIDESPAEFRGLIEAFIGEVRHSLLKSETLNAYSFHYHVMDDAEVNTDRSDLCFYLIDDGVAVDVERGVELMSDHYSNKLSLQNVYTRYNVEHPVSRCEVKTTTRWWSGYWWLWWLLIALALLIFILALICICLITWLWRRLTKRLMRDAKYAVSAVPLSAGSPHLAEHEWQEQVVHMD